MNYSAMIKHIGIALLPGIVMLMIEISSPVAVQAQQPTDAAGNANWSTQCSASSRKVPLVCAMEQRVFVRETGKQFAKVTLQTGAAGSAETLMLIELPLGLSIADGVTIQVDSAKPETLSIETCEASGCYVTLNVDKERLAQLMKGTEMSLNFNNLQKQQISLPIRLSGFSEAYNLIK